MPPNAVVRRVRPYLFTSFRRCQSDSAPLRHYLVDSSTQEEGRKVTQDYDRRFRQLFAVAPTDRWYPRISKDEGAMMDMATVRRRYKHLARQETEDNTVVTVAGRVQSVRTAGKKLIFLTIEQGKHSIQGLVNLSKLSDANTFAPNTDADDALHRAFDAFSSVVRKGDCYAIQGHPHRTGRGELSIYCSGIPRLLAPSLHQVPDSLDAETRARKRHVDMLVDPSVVQTMKLRHVVEKSLTTFLDNDGFISVHTPILTHGAGGAAARPFVTKATEFALGLQLRIAPELWLKKLVVGGMDRVYELGPAFRNEGVDATHNPEFYICEFYQAYATLDDLMRKTEAMLSRIAEDVSTSLSKSHTQSLVEPPRFQAPFNQIEFIPALEHALGQPLPDLSSPEAADQLKEILRSKDDWVPINPSISRLLDALASHYLEPLSHDSPLFITHHPAALSPLAKHFTCPRTGQRIAARAELFIQGKEIANMYEEENSPFEQRRKFTEQAGLKDEDGMEVDEAYLEALEWGLPPTGGWGCGVDRLVMLFTGRERIGDVLAFGSLRNVVGSQRRRTRDFEMGVDGRGNLEAGGS